MYSWRCMAQQELKLGTVLLCALKYWGLQSGFCRLKFMSVEVQVVRRYFKQHMNGLNCLCCRESGNVSLVSAEQECNEHQRHT